jgi:hypothetical protein
MPKKSISDDVFTKDSVPFDEQAKEFSDSKTMDDSAAFDETSDQEANDDVMEKMADVSGWRAAKSLKQLQTQVNASFPGRNKASDGMIGDTAHCPGGSDHCPNIVDGGIGVVTAYDITHDPDSGCDMGDVTQAVINSRDSRVKYIIYNHRMCSSYEHGGIAAWTWRSYGGSNPHTKHAHFSVAGQKTKYDDTSSWSIGVGLGV